MPTLRRIVLSLLFLIIIYNLIFIKSVFPGISVAGFDLSGKSFNEAENILSNNLKDPEKVILHFDNQIFEVLSSDLGLTYDTAATTRRAFNLPRTGNFLFDIYTRLKFLVSPINIGVLLNYDAVKLDAILLKIANTISKESVSPSVKMLGNEVVVDRGRAGTKVDTDMLRSLILTELSLPNSTQLTIPVTKIDHTLSDSEAETFKTRAERYLGKSISMTFEFDIFNLSTSDILKLISPSEDIIEAEFDIQVFEIASRINREPQDPKFNFNQVSNESPGKVIEFLPAKDGVKLDTGSFKQKLIESMRILGADDIKTVALEIPVIKTPSKITTEEVNSFGIKELIGRGTSKFRGSIPSRVHNVSLAASRLNGILIKPGDTFSFNEALGDVSAFTGYQQAYVIKEGKTVLGDGGGVCQVSTTLFRATLNAGLPILERQAHAYRVGYYEQDSPPGLDATVYGPSPDLKILNDTGYHILIQTKTDTKNYALVFELYGTKDDRTVTVTKPAISNVSSPGEDLYIDDPTLPTGTIKQTEHRANGARVIFEYSVQKPGEELYKKTFISNYRPWQAVFLRGTAPIQ